MSHKIDHLQMFNRNQNDFLCPAIDPNNPNQQKNFEYRQTKD